MKERISYIRKGINTSLFLLIMGGIIVNSTFFLHAHKNESGKIVFHAHPFDKGAEKEDPLAQHSHRKIDLDYLNSLNHFTVFENVINLEYNPDVELELLSKPCLISNSDVYSLFTARGPPQSIV
jgi:hypothetical protein